MNQHAIHLFVFMTRKVSLNHWRRVGLLERELALYLAMRPHLVAITVVSWGGREDQNIIRDYRDLDVISNDWRLPSRLYARMLPHLIRHRTRGNPVYKSNQTFAADIALASARPNNAAFIARCGYMVSEFEASQHGAASRQALAAANLERKIFGGADQCIVTTDAARAILLSYGVHLERINVVPNFVDTSCFRPDPSIERRLDELVFVGRLVEQKNPLPLVRAAASLGLGLSVIGDGPLRDTMYSLAVSLGVRVRFHGMLPNNAIPQILQRAAFYVLPSHYEGHPKTLIEAMACGTPVIGADRPGIREIIEHETTGLLCEPTECGLRDAIQRLIHDPAFAEKLGKAGQRNVEANLTLTQTTERELAIYQTAWDAFVSRHR